MPIHFDVFHPNRIVVIVARGVITSDEVARAVREFIETGAVQYRKIVDISGVTTDLTQERLDAIVAFMRNDPRAATRGPLVFVIDPARNHWVHVFAEMTADERPVKVFHSIHQARRWLDEMLKVEAKR